MADVQSGLAALRWVAVGFLAAAVGSGAGGAAAAELVMFAEPGCGWCAQFDAEIGEIYPKTDEARRAPLRRVDLGAGLPAEFVHLRPVTFTPTFVLMEDGREIGRILGYPGEMHFWGLLGALLERLPGPSTSAAEAG